MRGFKSGISGEPHHDQTMAQQITAAPAQPVTADTTSAEERAPEPIA
jgi:hypothetical protein